ncbi:hypothetical protein KY46_18090 [Photobacterium halotolerans]|uniref:Uncharacterized protein n=1 Tax=Photobacterium halotolerans TaxID=265726 RepID=A0A0F5V8T3_9GAMM|nr:hypothetical protein KY46_18090 [Photobacterium halotolerans]
MRADMDSSETAGCSQCKQDVCRQDDTGMMLQEEARDTARMAVESSPGMGNGSGDQDTSG